MKVLNGIYQDANSVDQPEGTTFFVKNAVSNVKAGALNNENGFKFSAINDKVGLSIGSKIPLNFIPIGIIAMMDEVIVFSTDNTNSEIGLYNVKTDSYQTKINSQELAFNNNYPIEGAWNVNFEGDVIIGWTDFNNSPRVLNINKIPNPFTTSKIDIFKKSKTVNLLNYSVVDGGNFAAGTSIQPYYRYVNYSGDTTSWIPLPYIIFTDGNNKSIDLTFNDVDTNYDLFEVAFYFRTGNPLDTEGRPLYYERSYKQIQITSSTNITTNVTGFENFTELVQGELLIPALDYKTSFTCTELSKQFALGNLKSNSALRYQKYACNIKLKWYSEIVDYTAFSSKLEDKGYQHDEVMAFYIRFKLLNGNYSEAFHIPAPILSDFSSVVGNPNTYESQAKNYQINDYSVITDTTNTNNCKGTFSYWENKDEQYPKENLANINDEEFNGAYDYEGISIPSGRNLLTETCVNGIGKVKHFKFPSLQTMWTYYTGKGITEYGLSKLDRLGIIVDTDSIVIPTEIQEQTQGYEIFYAERTTSNTTILGQDYNITAAYKNSNSDNYITSGCNFSMTFAGNINNSDVDKTYTAMFNHSFDLLYNAYDGVTHAFPSINPTHLKFNFELNSKSNFDDEIWGGVEVLPDNRRVSLATKTLGGTSTKIYSGSEYLKKIRASGYLEHNTIATILNATKPVDNRFGASSYFIELDVEVPCKNVTPIYLSQDTPNLLCETVANTLHKSANYNLFLLRPNIYERFTQQNLVNTGTTFTNETGEVIVYGGDIFLSVCCSNTYGVVLADKISDIYVQDGSRCWHWYIAETRNNANKREIDGIDGNLPTRYLNYKAFYNLSNFGTITTNPFPVYDSIEDGISKGVTDGGLSITGTARYSYNPNYSATLNKFVGTIFNPNNRFSNNFPNRIIRSLPQGNDTKRLAWMDFKANDYYDVRRNRGQITALRQTDEGKLFIQCIQALFITNNKTTLSTTEVQLKLGAGDIFDIEPFEIIYDKDGYIGSQHRESCFVSRLGYCTVDSLQGKIFLINSNGSQPKEISGLGLKNFYLEYIRTIPNNLNYQGISKIFTCYDYYYNRLLISVKNEQQSFTISYSPELNSGNGAWLSFHDYICDILCNTRYNVVSFKDDFTGESNLYVHNIGDKKGVYYKEALTNVIKPFIVIPVFNTLQISKENNGRYLEKVFQSISWKTEVKNTISKYLETFSSISIWNDYQCSGEINLDFSPELGEGNIRKVKEYWFFDEFRDILIHNNVSPNDFSVFIKSLFEDYDIITSSIDITKDDFEQKRFNSTHILVRFKYNNNTNSEISIIDVDVNKNMAIR